MKPRSFKLHKYAAGSSFGLASPDDTEVYANQVMDIRYSISSTTGMYLNINGKITIEDVDPLSKADFRTAVTGVRVFNGAKSADTMINCKIIKQRVDLSNPTHAEIEAWPGFVPVESVPIWGFIKDYPYYPKNWDYTIDLNKYVTSLPGLDEWELVSPVDKSATLVDGIFTVPANDYANAGEQFTVQARVKNVHGWSLVGGTHTVTTIDDKLKTFDEVPGVVAAWCSDWNSFSDTHTVDDIDAPTTMVSMAAITGAGSGTLTASGFTGFTGFDPSYDGGAKGKRGEDGDNVCLSSNFLEMADAIRGESNAGGNTTCKLSSGAISLTTGFTVFCGERRDLPTESGTSMSLLASSADVISVHQHASGTYAVTHPGGTVDTGVEIDTFNAQTLMLMHDGINTLSLYVDGVSRWSGSVSNVTIDEVVFMNNAAANDNLKGVQAIWGIYDTSVSELLAVQISELVAYHLYFGTRWADPDKTGPQPYA